MFRIRRIYDDVLPANKEILRQVKEILRTRFSSIPEEDIELVGERLRNPFKQRFRTILFAAENMRRRLLGFATLLHEPEIGFCYLDWIATAQGRTGGGVGGALYEWVRREAAALGAPGLFFECLPDDPESCPDPVLLRENQDRLRFYERYGARPIIHSLYEKPVKEGDTCMPHLVYDALGRPSLPGPDFMQEVVRAVLERKYADYCPPAYVEEVVASFRDRTVALRPYRYLKPRAVKTAVEGRTLERIGIVVNDRHAVHHVTSRQCHRIADPP